jgi:hypothetical protein
MGGGSARLGPSLTLVEKKVSRTAAQELVARLRMLGSVSSARPAPPSRRTTIGPPRRPDLGASRLLRELLLLLLLSRGYRGVPDFARLRWGGFGIREAIDVANRRLCAWVNGFPLSLPLPLPLPLLLSPRRRERATNLRRTKRSAEDPR